MENRQRKRVVGLKYEIGNGLPKVILKGAGRLYDEVIERRNELTSIPVVKDEKLVNALYKLPVDAEIGPDLFELVAILLVHVYAVDKKVTLEPK